MDPDPYSLSSFEAWAQQVPTPELIDLFNQVVESQDARKTPPNNGYTSKVKVLDRYKIVGFISSGTYGRVYKAVGVNGQVGEFAIKK